MVGPEDAEKGIGRKEFCAKWKSNLMDGDGIVLRNWLTIKT